MFACIYQSSTAQSAVAIEYVNCISTDREDTLPHNECPGYDIKQSGDYRQPWNMHTNTITQYLMDFMPQPVTTVNRVKSAHNLVDVSHF